MKRRLTDKLVLLVKARHDPTAAAAIGSKAAAQTVWTFPFTAHKAGETIRGAAERALKEAIGPSQVRVPKLHCIAGLFHGMYVIKYCVGGCHENPMP